MSKPRTLYDKIWDDHVLDTKGDLSLIYIDRHLVHEVTSPQAFEGLRMSGRKVRAPHKTLAVVDHNIQTTDRRGGIADPESRQQVEELARNAREFGIEYYDEFDARQGVVHIIGPEQGFTLPGTTIVCGDSHTSTHGAFGALAHGIGTSEVEHVLATQTLDPDQGQKHAGQGRRRASARRHRQGHHSRHHRRDRDGGRHRPRDRILRLGDRGSFDGRADDGLQHVDRGRRARRHDRARRQDLRLSQGSAEDAEGRPLGSRDAPLGDAAQRRGRRVRSRRPAQRRRPAADRLLGHEPAGRGADLRRGAAGRGRRRPSRSAPRSGARSTIWGSRAARRSPTSKSIASSSARAPTGESRTCAPPRRSPRATRFPNASTRWSCRDRAGQGRGRGRRPGPDFPRRRLRVARAGLLDVPGDEPRQA